MGAADATRVQRPLPLGQHERACLLATESAMTAGLVLEVDLPVAAERPEHEEVAAFVERVQSRQVLERQRGVVRQRQRMHRGCGDDRASKQEDGSLLAGGWALHNIREPRLEL